VRTIAIIGGGFSGTLTAVNLARLGVEPLRVLLCNSRHPLGRGVAYGTNQPEHLLNVAARNMSAFPDLPSHFLDWLRNRADFATIPTATLREEFVPRRVYGDYLQDLLFWHSQPLTTTPPVQIEPIDDEIVDLEPTPNGGLLHLHHGATQTADQVVLATGNRPPRRLPALAPVQNHPAYHPNPWLDWFKTLPHPSENVLLLGAGLTMVDAFLTLNSAGWQGTIHAVSRHGLLPLAHFRGGEYSNFPPDGVDELDLNHLVTLIEDHCARLRTQGMNPAIVVDRLRPYTQRIWRRLSLSDKQTFLSKYATRWNVIRHRIPPAVAGQVETARDQGRLRVHTGTIHAARADGNRLRVTIGGNDGQQLELVVGLLVNCTGPSDSPVVDPSPLYRNLFARGLIRPDELDMGIEVTPNFATVDQHGSASDFLYALGPLLRGTLWETTAVPELRSQAYQVARHLLEDRVHHPSEWVEETPANLLEYYI